MHATKESCTAGRACPLLKLKCEQQHCEVDQHVLAVLCVVLGVPAVQLSLQC